MSVNTILLFMGLQMADLSLEYFKTINLNSKANEIEA